jgi:hypothetical protein
MVVDNTVQPVQRVANGQEDWNQYDVPPGLRNTYKDLDEPTFTRHRNALSQDNMGDDLRTQELDYLDIPAFLRRQAD